MLDLVQDIGTKLRANRKKAGGISICIRNNELHSREWQCKFGLPTHSPTFLARAAYDLFRRSYRWELPIRSVTVRAIYLVGEDFPFQLDLFTDIQTLDKQERLDEAIESIRARFGKDAIKNAVLFQNIKLPEAKTVDLIMPSGMIG